MELGKLDSVPAQENTLFQGILHIVVYFSLVCTPTKHVDLSFVPGPQFLPLRIPHRWLIIWNFFTSEDSHPRTRPLNRWAWETLGLVALCTSTLGESMLPGFAASRALLALLPSPCPAFLASSHTLFLCPFFILRSSFSSVPSPSVSSSGCLPCSPILLLVLYPPSCFGLLSLYSIFVFHLTSLPLSSSVISHWAFFSFLSLAEIGDFDETLDREHLAKNKYIPQQDALEDKIMEFHRNHM